MATELRFADVGEGITEGRLLRWRVKEGDIVEGDQTLAEAETDKAIVELPAPTSGKIVSIRAQEGAIIKVGDVLAEIDGGTTGTPTNRGDDHGGVVGQLDEAADTPAETENSEKEKAAAAKPQPRAMPGARKLARERSLDLSGVEGTGRGGIITVQDVHYASRKERRLDGKTERIPISGIRRVTFHKMMESAKAAAQVSIFDEADISRMIAARNEKRAGFETKGIKLTFMPFIIQAVVGTLKEHPRINAQVDEERGELILKYYYHIGVAVDTPDGLLVPVIHDADEKSLEDLSRDLLVLSASAKARKLGSSDMKGGTFTISNIGAIGSLYATPLLNHPEIAILAIGRMADRPAFSDEGITRRQVLPLSLTFDHRVIDGAEAARFLNALRLRMETGEF